MNCEIFIVNSEKEYSFIEQELVKRNCEIRVITTIEKLNHELIKKGINSKNFFDEHLETSDSTREINQQSFKILNSYKNKLNEIKYDDKKIFNILENQLFEEIIFLEKIKKLLKQKNDIIFIFKKFSMSLISILDEAKKEGFKVCEYVKLVEKNNIHNIKSYHELKTIEFRNKISTIKNQIGTKNTISFASKLLGQKLQMKKSKAKIFNKIENKIIGEFKFKQTVGFFITTDREDFVEPIIPIINKMNYEKMHKIIFCIDLMTKNILEKKKLSFLDFTNEIYELMGLLNKDEKIKKIINEINEIAKNENFSILYRDQFEEFWRNEIIHGIAMHIIIEYLVEKIQFINIQITIDGSLLGNICTSVAKKFKIPTLSIEAFYVNENVERLFLYKSDKICIYGNQGKRALEKIGYRNDQIIVTGNPLYDKIEKNESENDVLVAMSRWHQKDSEWMTNLIKYCNINNLKIIIKIHPIYKNWRNFQSRSNIENIEKKCKNLEYEIMEAGDVSGMISKSSIIITDFSNVGINAILSNKHLITVNFEDENYKNVIKFSNYGCPVVTNDTELYNIINSIKKGNIINIDKKQFEFDFNYKNDGNAHKRIYKILKMK